MSANHQSEQQLRHERLCAYLFDELDAPARAAVEAELAADPELAAERDRLAATIALVRDAIPAEEALSSDARGALTAAAARRAAAGGGAGLAPVHPWPVRLARSPLAAAAAVIAVLGVLAGIGMNQDPPAVGSGGDAAGARSRIAKAEGELAARDARAGFETARAARGAPGAPDASDDAAPREEAAGAPADAPGLAANGLDADGAGPGAKHGAQGEAPPAAAAAPAETSEEADAYFTWRSTSIDPAVGQASLEAVREDLRKMGYAGGATRAAGRPASELESRMQSLGYLGGEGGGGASGADLARDKSGVVPYTDRIDPIDLNRFGADREDAQYDTETLAGGALQPPPPGGPGTPGPAGEPRARVRVEDGADGWFLGLGQTPTAGGDGRVVHKIEFGAAAGEGRSNTASSAAVSAPIDNLGELLAFADGGRADGAGEARRAYAPERSDEDVRAGVVFHATPAHRGLDRYPADEIIRFCRIRPHESPSAMFFRCWGDNPFELAALDPVSTFAADVDTASYALARSYLAKGYMPTKEQIRTEEFVNSFDSGVTPPVEDVFKIDLEMAPSPFSSRPDTWMLRTVVRGKEVDKRDRPSLALTFVVDVSGSMKQGNRIELVKHALRLLVGELDQNDAVAIVAFSNEARLVLPMTSAGNKPVIESAIFGLNPDGSTNAEAGLLMGYAQAAQGLTPGANNRVVMLSDGVANVGNTDEGTLLKNVAAFRSQGIYLNTIGVGMGNHNDALLEQLADRGDGICNYVDTADEAMRVLVEGFTGQFTPIARDVKIQVEFDPAQVESYRLLGYENRAIADERFRDDTVDAGEVGAGHQVTALYEVVRTPSPSNDGPLATARVRFKPPFAIDSARTDAASRAAAETAREIERGVAFREVVTSFRGASVGFQRAALVAQLAELLRRSVHARGDSYDALVTEAIRLEKVAEDPAFTELTTLLAASRDLIVRHLPPDDAVARAIDELTRHNYLQGKLAQLEAEDRELSAELLAELQGRNAELERRIRELLEGQRQPEGR